MVLKFLIFLATIHGFLTSITESVRFDLESGNTKCISEDIKSNSMTVGNYRIVNPSEPHHFHPSSTEQAHQPLPESYKLTVRVIFYFLFFTLFVIFPFLGFWVCDVLFVIYFRVGILVGLCVVLVKYRTFTGVNWFFFLPGIDNE